MNDRIKKAVLCAVSVPFLWIVFSFLIVIISFLPVFALIKPDWIEFE